MCKIWFNGFGFKGGLTICLLVCAEKRSEKKGASEESHEVMKKPKVEDDEYKTTTEEHTYYRYMSLTLVPICTRAIQKGKHILKYKKN